MRPVNYIIIHCSATESGAGFTVKDIDRWHKEKGWTGVGYHYVITEQGKLEQGRPPESEGAHCLHHNSDSIGICYIGGLRFGNPFDTRTPAQCAQLEIIVRRLLRQYPDALVCGHRDLSPDLDGNGKITPGEWTKACPCFDVAEWAKSVGIPASNIL